MQTVADGTWPGKFGAYCTITEVFQLTISHSRKILLPFGVPKRHFRRMWAGLVALLVYFKLRHALHLPFRRMLSDERRFPHDSRS
jgi:hypothetical protein